MIAKDSRQLPEFPERLGKELRKAETRVAARAVVKLMLQDQADEDTAAASLAHWMPRHTPLPLTIPSPVMDLQPAAGLLPLLSGRVMWLSLTAPAQAAGRLLCSPQGLFSFPLSSPCPILLLLLAPSPSFFSSASASFLSVSVSLSSLSATPSSLCLSTHLPVPRLLSSLPLSPFLSSHLSLLLLLLLLLSLSFPSPLSLFLLLSIPSLLAHCPCQTAVPNLFKKM